MDEDPIPMERQLFAALGAIVDIVKPSYAQILRPVLEANENIVKQDDASLTYLTNELVAALTRPLERPFDE